ncbi:MAG TPA: TMEM175 family protein [Bacteroidales bacterium]|nr:TMEM175 family protein [Bacteroidales bacterium]
MTKTRLEAFSDGVLAIVITIMVLELKVPHDISFHALWRLGPVFISYVLSFVFVGIYWGNHHHLLHTVQRVSSRIIWANMALLFALSLIPFTTGWMGENNFARLPVAVYAINLLFCSINFYILQKVIITVGTKDSALIDALRKQEKKGITSLLVYAASVGIAFIYPFISAFLFAVMAVWWLIPNKNIEKALEE